MTAAKKSAKASPKSSASSSKAELDQVRDIARSGRSGSTKITTSSTAEYFSKNLQQVGFSCQIKATLTPLKEAVDNALDACEEHGILPEVKVVIEKLGTGSIKNSDQVRIVSTTSSRISWETQRCFRVPQALFLA